VFFSPVIEQPPASPDDEEKSRHATGAEISCGGIPPTRIPASGAGARA
jgi:hypothetical protein